MRRFWNRSPDAHRSTAPNAAGREALTERWQHQLRLIGAQIDATGSVLHGVIVSITDTEVWVAGMESNAVRAQLGWSARLVQVQELSEAGSPPMAADGPWATRLRAVGWALDAEERAVEAPCILHLEPGFLVTARVATIEGWEQMDWRLTETGLRSESV